MSILGGILGGIAGKVVGGLFSSKQASKQMDFQERMSSTSYQRAMEDMKLAGLNPILAGKFGGASTPQGAMATMGDINIPQDMATAKGMEKTDAEIDHIEQQVSNLESAKNLTDSQVTKVSYDISLIIEQMHKIWAEKDLIGEKADTQHFLNAGLEVINNFIRESGASSGSAKAGGIVQGTAKVIKDWWLNYYDNVFESIKNKGDHEWQ